MEEVILHFFSLFYIDFTAKYIRTTKTYILLKKPHGGESMVKVRNIFGDVYSGKVGKSGVFAHWKGRQYRRSYVIPANPRTPMQQAVRNSFKNAVAAWHDFSALQKEAYNYLATPQQISGFNLWVSRYQKAATAGLTLPEEPKEGVKQIGSASSSAETTFATGQGPHDLDGPVKLFGATYDKGTGSTDPTAIIWIDRGAVEFLKNVSGEVTIDYQAGGRAIEGEAVATDPSAGDIVYLEWWPVNFKSVKLYVGGSQVESIEVDAANAQAYFDLAGPDSADQKLTYTKYTPLANAKLEIYKSGTSQLVWRGYSDAAGFLEVAATIEDAPYDFQLSAAGYTMVSRVGTDAAEATKEELIIMS